MRRYTYHWTESKDWFIDDFPRMYYSRILVQSYTCRVYPQSNLDDPANRRRNSSYSAGNCRLSTSR